MFIGCHVSIAGGIQNAPKRAADLGCEAMQIFTRSPQGGKAPELTTEIINQFKLQVTSYELREIVVHTPYFINFPSENNRIRYGSMKVVREELERASLIDSKYVMTHLGSAGKIPQKDAITKTVEMLQKTLDGYTSSTKLLIENSAGAGNILGDDLKEIAQILKKVNHPALCGICLDTQHAWASGYDWQDFEKTIQSIDKEIGIENIKLIHANDSQTDLGSKKDRHEHIGKGEIGQDAFKNITTFAKEKNIPMILETEHDFVKEDIELLKSFRE